MNYMTLQRAPQTIITANIPPAPKPTPTMGWADMCKAEGHIGKAPSNREEAPIVGPEILGVLSDGIPRTASMIGEVTGVSQQTSSNRVKRMVQAGLLSFEMAFCERANRKLRFYRLTEAGGKKASDGRLGTA